MTTTRRLALPSFLLVAVTLLAVTAQAGNLSPALESALADTPPDQALSVIVHMSEQAPIAAMNLALRQEKSTLAKRHRDVIHALKEAATSQDALLAEFDNGAYADDVAGYTSYWISNLVVVKALPAAIEHIAARPDVSWVELNFTPVLIEPVISAGSAPQDNPELPPNPAIGLAPGIEAVRADEVWYQYGFTGASRLLGSCDTGVDGNHPALADRWRGANGHPWQECWLDVIGGPSDFPSDDGGHGTHTTGTMTGLAPNDSIGVAPGAMWIASNVINQGVNSGFDNDVIQTYQWFTDPDGDPETTDDVPDAVCNSWGVNQNFPGYGNCDSRWWNVIDNCEAAGVVTVWAAGNEGPGSSTMRSPADRATTLTNSFSVGAVNATNYDFPYPIWSGSSRGPTECAVPEPNRIKPEVSAPGVSVYSSVPGGGYQGGWTGTSMATPHVAGVVALMREANPNLDVDSIKNILMESSVDHGSAGEDNAYGWGMLDAMTAVELVVASLGGINGTVTNGSYGDLPIPGADVQVLGITYSFISDENGYYAGNLAAGDYTVQVEMQGFALAEADVSIDLETPTTQNFSLTDIAGPAITDVAEPLTSPGEVGPYNITADLFDLSSIAAAKVMYRVDGGDWQEVAMTPATAGFSGPIPGQPTNSVIDYYVWAQDGVGFESVEPADAPASFYSLAVTNLIYSWDAEDPGDPQWQLGLPGDDATAGHWIRAEPVGTWQNDEIAQTDDDHTADPGYQCFVTANGSPGDPAYLSDVDNGCTTMLSPTMDLSGASRAFVNFQRWFFQYSAAMDDEFRISVSDDGGDSWVDIDMMMETANYWTHIIVELTDLIDMSDQVVFRFQACDLGVPGTVEAALDDFSVETLTTVTTAVGDEDGQAPVRVAFGLAQNHPNPFNPMTTISFTLARDEQVELAVYGVDGGRIATLLSEQLPAGAHQLSWDGKNDRGQQVASGTYFYRLQAGRDVATKRMVLLK